MFIEALFVILKKKETKLQLSINRMNKQYMGYSHNRVPLRNSNDI